MKASQVDSVDRTHEQVHVTERVEDITKKNAASPNCRLPEMVLDGLCDEDARSLLATVIPGRIDERVRDRIVAETRGNPLALLELPRGLSARQLAGGFGLPDPVPLTGRIEESFLRRLEDLPDDTRLLLLVAASEPVGDPALMWRAAAHLGIPRTALDPATRMELLDVGARGALPASIGAIRGLPIGLGT